MVVVILVLPSMYMVFDKLICVTSAGFKPKQGNTPSNAENV